MKYTIQDIINNQEKLSLFIGCGYFEIKQQGNYLFFGVKEGYLKPLINRGYTKKQILNFLNLIEWGLNNGFICPECLEIARIFVDSETNALISECSNHGGLI